MKPEHFCSGNQVDAERYSRDEQPSMKPEHFCSGNKPATPANTSSPSPFNEAGAFLLRKPRSGLQLSTTYATFNEAGAFLLRKRNQCGKRAVSLNPSMKPEHFCSGNGLRPHRQQCPFLPSMKPEHFCSGNSPMPPVPSGRCASFNEAGAFLLRKLMLVALFSEHVNDPSMKPEHFCSGNAHQDVWAYMQREILQ